jgi:hypothetical protein
MARFDIFVLASLLQEHPFLNMPLRGASQFSHPPRTAFVNSFESDFE